MVYLVLYCSVFAVSELATHVTAPTEYDLQEAYHVVRYLYNTKHLGLTFDAHGAITMYGYVDAAYNIHQDAKGHTGIHFTLGKQDAPFDHKSKKQSLVATSNMTSHPITEEEKLSYRNIANIRARFIEAMSHIDIIYIIDKRRWQWLGHVLRMKHDRLAQPVIPEVNL